jgi:hypothetical protein
MNVSSVTSANSLYQPPYQTGFGQGPQDFESLANALQSGSLTGAQSAFSSLQKDLPGLSQLLQTGSSSSPSPAQNNPIATALQSLQSALQSGDLSGAQQAFANLQQGLQGAGAAHRRHHHHNHNTSGTNGTNATNPANQTRAADSDGDSDGSSRTASSSSVIAQLLNVQA